MTAPSVSAIICDSVQCEWKTTISSCLHLCEAPAPLRAFRFLWRVVLNTPYCLPKLQIPPTPTRATIPVMTETQDNTWHMAGVAVLLVAAIVANELEGQ